MPRGGFLEQKTRSPGGLALVIVLHGAVLTALMLANNEYVRLTEPPIVVTPIPDTPEPPPIPEPEPDRQAPKQKSEIRYVPPEVPAPRRDDVVLGERTDTPVIFDSGPIGTAEPKIPEPAPLPPQPQPQPLPEPVRVEARLDTRSELQPPYPASEQRAQNEGSVTVRILIGADGRVKQVEKVKATSDAFFRATEQQALRHWRYKPATLDGKPIESRTTVTVRFRLDE
jgi:protein TonB